MKLRLPSFGLVTILFIFILSTSVSAQSINLKAGLNYANISKPELTQFNSTSKSGFLLGAGLTTNSGFVRLNSELIYSKQGYDFKNGTTNGSVNLKYILLPQYVSLNIGEIFSIHTGLQIAFVSDLKIDSTTLSGQNISLDNLAKNIKKASLSVLAGVELSPIKGVFIGTRYNHPLGNFLKNDADKGLIFAPDKNLKNNLIQIYAGFRFSLDGYRY